MGLKKTLMVYSFIILSASTARGFENPAEFPKGWMLNNAVKNSELRVITDKKSSWDPQAAIWRGDTHAFVRGHLMSKQFAVSGGDELEISFYAKDPDGKDVACKAYVYSRSEDGKLHYSGGLPGFSSKTGAEWSLVSGKISIPWKLKYTDKSVDAVIVVLVSDTGAYFDYPSISHVRKGEFSNTEYAIHESAGRQKLAQGNYTGARKEFNIALKFAETEGERKLAFSSIEEIDRTEKIATTSKKAETVFKQADAFVKKGRYRDARAEYEGIKKMSGMDYLKEIALFNIAELYLKEKDYANAHRTYSEIFAIPDLTVYYFIYGLFRQAEAYAEEKKYNKARQLYGQVEETEGALEHHIFRARLFSADTYRLERKHGEARKLYKALLLEQETSGYPHEGYRRDIIDRLESVEGLAEGQKEKSRQEKRVEWINSPKQAMYVSLEGSDRNPGTKEKPFATIERAQEEVRRIKSGKGMPEGGVAVYIRGGKYFITESISFGKEDSGTEGSPVVYRSYPGEEVRIIGGRRVTNFKPLGDPDILSKLPEESRGRVWVADLKAAGITDYGKLLDRGGSYPGWPGFSNNPSAMELFFNGRAMQLARWPNEGWVKVAGIEPDGERRGRGPYQLGEFQYAGDRPERWTDEKDVWLHGYWLTPYQAIHVKLKSFDTGKRTISLALTSAGQPIRRAPVPVAVANAAPYYAYNLLSEIEVPGEWYIDRDTGKLYFYPPEEIQNSEAVVSTMDKPLITTSDLSNTVFYGMTFEVTRRDAIVMAGGRNNLIAKSVIRNSGQWAVKIESGWEHSVIGCDIYDTGEGGVSLNLEKSRPTLIPGRKELIPARHTVENNHIYRFNRFHGGYRPAVRIEGVGQRVSHNLINDSPMPAIEFNHNDHVIEFNEFHDVLHTGREMGAIYVYGEPWYMMSRGTVMRNNFFHHISSNSSPNLTQHAFAIVLDCINSGIVMENNIFFRVPRPILLPGPDNRIENNLFIDSEHTIQLNNMWTLFNNSKGEPIAYRISRWAEERLKVVRYKQPPWSSRYPQMVNILSDKTPVGWAKGIAVSRNINTGGRFMTFGGVRGDMEFSNNWTVEAPLFIDRNNMDFSLRPGAPAYGLTGLEPLSPMEDTGVYKDVLRASWPVNRTQEDIGRYYYHKPPWAVSDKAGRIVIPAPVYNIPAVKAPVKIDGKLKKEEWSGLDMKSAMVIEHHHTGDNIKGAKSYAWLFYDKDYLYIAMKHDPDPYMDDMPESRKKHMPSIEVAIESRKGSHSLGWWFDDKVTAGPIYSISANYNGQLKLNNLFGMPDENVKNFETALEYKASIVDEENSVWTSEMKIPLEKIGVNPNEVDRLAFNIGVAKRRGWFAWVPTGSSIWRIENAGLIKFDKN